MKKISIMLALLAAMPAGYAQTSSEVFFDNYVSSTDNDLVNFFTGDYTFYQVPTSGITGGSIKIDSNYNSGLWNTDDRHAFFYETFDGNFDSLIVSVCFKYGTDDPSPLATAMLRVRTLSDQPDTTFSAINCFYSSNGVEFISSDLTLYDGSGTIGYGMPLLTAGYWYRQTLKIVRPDYGDGWGPLSCTGRLEDIGPDGVSDPDTLTAAATFGLDNVEKFYSTGARIKIGLCGNIDGGGTYLDNFNAVIYYPDSAVSVSPVKPAIKAVVPTIFSDHLAVTVPDGGDCRYSIYDIGGKVYASGRLERDSNINTAAFVPGTYYIAISNAHARLVKKIVKQ